jgi:DNA-binding transcriptional regulator YiaG
VSTRATLRLREIVCFPPERLSSLRGGSHERRTPAGHGMREADEKWAPTGYPSRVTPEEIKALRQELSCTARELATALDIGQDVVLAWERAELFPTKRHVDQMAELRKKGPSAIPRKKRGAPASPMHALADPDLWRLVRKLIAHPPLRAAVTKLAEPYDDPADS